MYKQVVCFGEALIDFLNVGSTQDGLLTLNQFTQFPGGAPANAAVAVAKLGGQAKFVGQVGNDPFGHFLIQSLNRYQVDTQFTYVHPSAKTALAFVFLDQRGERTFSFHRENTADLVFEAAQVDEAWFSEPSIFHFCSNTLTERTIASVTDHIVQKAKQHQCLISFDVNLRHNLWASGSVDASLVNQFVMQSQLVKFAKEELAYLSGGQVASYLADCFENGVKVVVITDGGNSIAVYTATSQFNITPPNTEVVDTTGGGDAFIGAVLYGLCQSQTDDFADTTKLARVIEFASQCGAIAVSRQGAFPAFPQNDEVKEFEREF
jgi:fructokinase